MAGAEAWAGFTQEELRRLQRGTECGRAGGWALGSGGAGHGAVEPAGPRHSSPSPPPDLLCLRLPVFSPARAPPCPSSPCSSPVLRFIKPELPTGPPLALHLALPWAHLHSSPKLLL